LAMDPSPIEISVAAANNSLSNSSQGSLEPTHGLSGDFQADQSHRSLRVRPNFFMSWTPSPLSCLGLQKINHLT
jgi:hypothetical protein